ncbi:M20/M25/M40 family metallo-hydrolase [Marinifilum fragile]|uniref:M20/M25/M40 family metallo-hydrolase n=1 Tax=Marinifilum fragile TaxID=570161 RepID=UPI002AA87E24|nr:M20/M25/M40 family metallo-hydrolase [Marinifilum fragile]
MKVAIIYNKDITGVINTLGMQNREFYKEEQVKRVANCLEKAGHNVSILDGNMYIIERLQNFMPRTIEGEQMGMVFNMAYGIQGESRYTHIPSMLEMLGIPYVGSNPSGHALALDKVMTKIIWQSKGLPTPDFWVFNSPNDDLSGVKFPVIVKPKMESVSFGLKVVYNEEDLRESINFVVTEFQQQALVEQFIRGREFCVGLLGNTPIEAFPVLEIDLEGNPDGIQTVTDKKEKPKQKICPANISPELSDEMIKYSIEAFKALELRDFARVDIRLDENGKIYLLEINSMASLGATGSYPTAAKVAGYDFSKLVNKMLDVASVRYFSNSLMTELPEEKNKSLSFNSRIRSFLRSRQQNSEALLKKMVNIDTHVRNIEGVNECASLIRNELSQLGFAHEVFPQYEVGNMMYFSNSFGEDVDYLILMPIDDFQKLDQHENFSETEHRLYGTGVWESKAGVMTCISALQSLRFTKQIRKTKIGIVLITDNAISGKFSRKLIREKAMKAKTVLSLHGGGLEDTVVTSRSGSALFSYNLKLMDNTQAENVTNISQLYFKTLASIIDLSKNNPENVIAPYESEFKSNIFKVHAYGTSKISIRFNSEEEFKQLESKIKKMITLPKVRKKDCQVQLEGGVSRPPMECNNASSALFKRIKSVGRSIDTRIQEEHRWSSSDICSIDKSIAKIDGLGPIGGFDKQKSEFILRHSLVDRALLLSLILGEK